MENLTIDKLLFNDEPITINRKLAKCLGLTEAVIFQQIHYWLKINEKTNKNFKNGRHWTYNSIENWHKREFDFLSKRTIQRKLDKLEQLGLLETNVFNKMKGDKTKWYTINYDKLLEVCKKELLNKEKLIEVRKQAGLKGAISKHSTDKDTMMPKWHNDNPSCQSGTTMMPSWHNDDAKVAEPIPKITTKTSTKTTNCSSSIDLIGYFELDICYLRKTTRIKFTEIINKYDADFIKSIIEQCCFSNIKSYAGFEKVFNSYLDRHCTTRQDVEQATSEYRIKHTKKETKGNTRVNKGKDLKFNNFEPREYDYDELEKNLLPKVDENKESEAERLLEQIKNKNG